MSSTNPLPPANELASAVHARWERHGMVAVIILDRPGARNAVDARLSAEAGAALAEAENDPGIRAVVVTGAGPAFCAGADLKEIAAGRRVDDPAHPERGFAGIVRHWISKPLIAAVNGPAMGGGTEIVLACDLAVADNTATFGLPEVTRGIFPAAGGALRLQRQIPLKVAAELALTGRPVTAARAYELGLVNRVVPAGQSLSAAVEMASVIASNGPTAVRETKQFLHAAQHLGSDWADRAWQINDEVMRRVLRSADAREGAKAFAQHRDPVWGGR